MPGKKRIYMDNTGTARTRREVISVMKKYFSRIYANPSSVHRPGLEAKSAVETARENIASILNCGPEELIFTGSGSESNNLAIQGVARALSKTGSHIITSGIEHSSILSTCKAFEKEGFEVTYLGVDEEGHINLEQLKEAIKPNTILVTLGYVNNEIGTIQDIDKIVSIVKSRGIILHLDAVQALPYLKLDLTKLNVDLVSFSGHKFYAPKGIGLLYVKKGTPVLPLIYGGGHESGLRNGTENVPYIAGLSRAIFLNNLEKDSYNKKLIQFRDKIIAAVAQKVPDVKITGDPVNRTSNNASFCFKGIDGRMLVKELSGYGIAVSSGSACSSHKNGPSHVLEACGISKDYIHGGLRVTLGRYNTGNDIDYFLAVLPKAVDRMRSKAISRQYKRDYISIEEFREKIDAGEKMQILDIRFPKIPGYEIPGAIRVPFWKVKANLPRLDRNLETVVICINGMSAGWIQPLLKKNRFRNAKILEGGILNYLSYFLTK